MKIFLQATETMEGRWKDCGRKALERKSVERVERVSRADKRTKAPEDWRSPRRLARFPVRSRSLLIPDERVCEDGEGDVALGDAVAGDVGVFVRVHASGVVDGGGVEPAAG